jgi:hypothetical protein
MFVLPKYEVSSTTQRVPEPIPAEPVRRRSLGPWQLSRRWSEADRADAPPTYRLFDDPPEPMTLKTLLNRLDEHCEAVNKILIEETEGNISINVESDAAKDPNDTKTTPKFNKKACKLLGRLLAVATIFVFTAPPLMARVFARTEWGPVILHEDAPSKTALAATLSIPTIATGYSFSVAAMALASMRNGYNFADNYRKGWIATGLALLGGIILDIWTLVWILPIMKHA